MKKIILLISVIVMFSGCEILIDNYPWIPPSEIDTYEKVCAYMLTIDYVASPSINMDTAETVYNRGYGDCDGMSHLMASFFKYNLGAENVEMIGCLFLPSMAPHMIFCADGKYYEATRAKEITHMERYKITNRMSYEFYEKLADIG